MVSRQGQAVAATATSGTPMQSHAPTAALPPSSAGKRRWDATCQRREPGPGPSKRAARSRPGISTSVPGDSRAFPSTSTLVSPGKGTAAQGRSGTAHARQQPVQYDSELHPKKASTLQPGKEACFLEQLHKHQAMVLHPDYRTPFRSLDDAVQRLLPYHIYQGTLPSDEECRKVDEEFEVVSAQLLKRSQAMLNKYRLLLLEESQVSPASCFPQGLEAQAFVQDRPLSWVEFPCCLGGLQPQRSQWGLSPGLSARTGKLSSPCRWLRLVSASPRCFYCLEFGKRQLLVNRDGNNLGEEGTPACHGGDV
ncbi:BRD4-interacting chromatin-remodeling complex-associated protein-like isoform X2 [Cuculus canorus]|uniref:BRD4-interacting chromatin-remodeling complex-associated protein-like isoform X2 n=1 Tax=Cuculus canorus TaxID=55661 RepID=UPI0023AB33C6|nr:BRD4-interacting chromatin-remodeling complex-associated protein-like isoform X2 [Cuculus canorus]